MGTWKKAILEGDSTLLPTGGTTGQVLAKNSATNYDVAWTTASGGGGTPAGSTGQIQYNNAGAFGAEAALFYDATNNRLSVGGDTSPGATLEVRGEGTTTGAAFNLENSSGTERFKIQDDGRVLVTNHSTYAANTPGLSVTKTGTYWGGISLRHTGISQSQAAGNAQDSNTFGIIFPENTTGGLSIFGFTATNQQSNAVKLSGILGTQTPTTSAFRLQGSKWNGGSGYTTIGNAEPVLSYANFATELFIQLGSGAVGIRNTAPTSTTTLTVRGQGTSTGISLRTEDSGGGARFTVEDRGTIYTNERNDIAASVHSFVLNATKNEYWRPTIAFKNTSFSTAIAAWLGDTNTLGYFGTLGGTAATGGLGLYGASSGASASNPTWQMQGFHGSTAPTEAIIRLVGTKYAGSGSGSNMLAALADAETILHVINSGTVGGTNVRMAILGSGAMGLRNTAPTSTTSLTVRGHGTTTGISLLVENSGGTARFTVRDDGAYAFAGGIVGAAQTGYTTPTNLTTDRTFDANATTIDELADVLGTLIEDLKTKGIISA